MTTLINGMTSADFIAALNSNFEDICGAGNYTTITDEMQGTTLETNLNTGLQASYSFVGAQGTVILNILNTEFDPEYISTPSGLVLEWENDYCKIDFTDNSGDEAQHEIWERKDGGDYSLAHTLDAGIETYNYKTWMNASVDFKIRAKEGSKYSKYCALVNIATPICYVTDQSTLTTVNIGMAILTAGKHVVINWGDGTSDDMTGTDSDNFLKDYASEGTYYITFTGDIDYISSGPGVHDQEHVGGDLTKLCWENFKTYKVWHSYGNNFTGDITNWRIPVTTTVFHCGMNHFTGDITNLWNNENTVIYDFHCSLNDGLVGDSSGWIMPDTLRHMYVGDHITDFPRGSFKVVTQYQFQDNSITSEKIDAIIAYMENYWNTSGEVPSHVDGFRATMAGPNMGVPSAASLISIANIQAKYIAQGLTAQFLVNVYGEL